MGEKLVEYMSNMMEKEALQKAGEMLEGGEEPLKILDHCRAAMEIVG
ncbi:MAG: methionine synthase, partial [Deltaproteobacteria bacterium]|nr:methionine synthase [Deltaproteobacteria bacterium]